MAFGFNTPRFLGIDFGTVSVKAVEIILKEDKPVLVNYGRIHVDESDYVDQGVKGALYEEKMIGYLRALKENMKPQSASAYFAMPAFSGLIFFIELPLMDETELKEAIRFEAQKYIPSPLEEVALSWKVIKIIDTPENGKQMEILLVSALNKEINRYQKYALETGFRIDTLELETFSLIRSLIGDEQGAFLIIDIGSCTTNLILVDDGIVKMSRNLNTGGKDITHTIQSSLNITNERAISLKKSGKNFFTAKEMTFPFLSLQTIAEEASRMLEGYKTKYHEKGITKVILSGGTAHFPGITDYYSELLHLPVERGDPWKRIQYDPKLEPFIQEFGTSFSVAIGLALTGIDNLLAEENKKKNPLIAKKKFSFKDMFTKEL